jgi:RNA polymerase sigma factor (sigma-70 family)
LKQRFPPDINSPHNTKNVEAEDNELVQATSQGDLTAFNELVLKYQDQVFNLARFILDNQDLADDITQMTFILAFQKIHQFRGGSFRAWVLKIAKNLCYDEMRRWEHSSHQSLEPTDQEGKANESPYWLKDLQPLPEEIVETGDLYKRVEDGLNKLPLKFRTIVTLIDIQQMDYKEASLVAGVPLGTVKSRLARGRIQLRSILLDTAKPYSRTIGEYV